jgi:hypothetical protein
VKCRLIDAIEIGAKIIVFSGVGLYAGQNWRKPDEGMLSGKIYPTGISGSLSIIGTAGRVSQPE